MSSSLYEISGSSKARFVRFQYNNEEFVFDMAKESRIVESSIDVDLKNLPQKLSFLRLLRDYYNGKIRNIQRQYDVKASGVWVKENMRDAAYYKDHYKTPPKDYILSLIDKDSSIMKMRTALDKYQKNLENAKSCIYTLEQKVEILRTLSANLRREK